MKPDLMLPTTYEFILQHLSDGVVVLDAQNRILYLNPAARQLISHAGPYADGRPIEQVWAEWSRQMKRPFNVGELQQQVVLGQGEEQRTYDVRISPMVNSNDQLISLMTLRDITEQVRTNELLYNELRQELAGRVQAEAERRRLNTELEKRLLVCTTELKQTKVALEREIGERQRAEAEFLQRNRELLSLQSAAAAIVSNLDIQFVLDTVTWEMVNLLGVEGCAISAWDQETGTIAIAAEYGSGSFWDEKPVTEAYSVTDYPTRRQVLVERYAQQMTVSQPDIDATELTFMQMNNIKTLLMLPMVFQDRVVGLVEITDRQVERTFTDHEISLAQLLANQTASAVENARLYERAKIVIQERIQAEELIKTSLKEKEVLLKEIHHRVKNNLQIISSLLNLQARQTEHPTVLEMFRDSQNRIRSMALIHEKLYRSHDLARIDFAEYVRNLSSYLVRSYQASLGPVTLEVDADEVFLSIDTAVPCGLIINELVSNTLKHAFPPSTDTMIDDSENKIRIELRSGPDKKLILSIADNGVGFPKDLDFYNTDSLGLQLVTTLVNQLDGELELHSNGGAEFKITFPLP